MVKIVCKKGDNIYTLSVSTAIIEEVGAVEVYGIRIMGKCQTAEVDDISADYHGITIRSIGIYRAWFNIGLTNLIYNFFRYEFLKRPKPSKG